MPTTTEECACPAPGHGARICDENGCGQCMCLLLEPTEPDQSAATTFYVDPDVSSGGNGSADAPWLELDWTAVDSALAQGNVYVVFSALEADGKTSESWPGPLIISRTDVGPNRVVLDGISHYNADDRAPTWRSNLSRGHAIVRGVTTGFDDVERPRVSVRGFEVTGSTDKGVYWRAGDDIVLEDLIVHDNQGSPAVYLEYSSRSGLASSSFIFRNSHVYNQLGEGVYIGGSEGEDKDSHTYVEVSNNLIHHIWNYGSTEYDGINIKDRILDVNVSRNVLFTTHWGIEAASPGTFRQNLVFDTRADGFHLNDYWGTGMSGMSLQDNTILRAGENGIRIEADTVSASHVTIEGTTVLQSAQAGLLVAASQGMEVAVNDIELVNNQVGMDGWGEVTMELSDCVIDGNLEDDSGAMAGVTTACESRHLVFGDLSNPAGPDGIFFTADDATEPQASLQGSSR